ncbi:inositol monophosphatase family protein [Nocardia sp. CA-290969]|uniref:inositol monophosphatase family protein n=1 Tax=Nocardia sp. CA-290969 TaxID=3239986 RepID=UPI003D8D8BA8
MCAVSLALVCGGRPKVGVIRAPFLGLEYYAAEGSGAFANEAVLATDTAQRRGEAIVSWRMVSGPAAESMLRVSVFIPGVKTSNRPTQTDGDSWPTN